MYLECRKAGCNLRLTGTGTGASAGCCGTRVIDHSSIQSTVDYAPGYESKDHVWKKGKFIQVTVTADVHGFTQWFKKPKTVRCIMMIENGGESS